MKFHFGLGKFFSVYDKKNNQIMRQVIENNFGIHYCLDYPGSGKFFRHNTSKNERDSIKAITRVPCFDTDILKDEVDLTLNELDIGKIDTLQLWGGKEVFDCYDENSKLFSTLSLLQEQGKINSFLPQMYYDQTVQLSSQNNNKLKSFAFYGSPVGMHISEELIKSNTIENSIAMSIFGGVDKNVVPKFSSNEEEEYWKYLINNYSWTEICLSHLESFNFINRVVGTTGNIKHFQEIIDYFNDNNSNPVNNKPELLQNISIQSCTKEHMAVENAQERWTLNHERLRSGKTYYKSLGYYYIRKYQWLHKFINFILRRK
jgi:hypothetical protein